MVRPANPTVSRRELANTLRHLRQRARKTLEEAAGALEVSAATLSRIETGVRVPRARDVKDLCEFYGLTDTDRIRELTLLVADAKDSGWWEAYTEVDDEYATYIGLEAAATRIEQFEGGLVPALLQTADYNAAFLRMALNPARQEPFSDHDIVKRIEVSTRRQQLLERGLSLRYSAIIDEAVLRRAVGSREIMRNQVELLLHTIERTEAEILLLPFRSGAHPGQQGRFSILTLPQEHVSDVVYIESLAAQIFLESATEIDRYRNVFAELRLKSLDQNSSREALLEHLTALQPLP